MLVVVCGAFFGIKAAFKPNHQIDPSKLAKIERGDIARSVVATGKIQPRSKVEVKSKASGIVKKLMVDYGEFVRQGQVLAELDKEELQAQVREAKASCWRRRPPRNPAWPLSSATEGRLKAPICRS
jgi:HlyD family secretion protein